MKKNGFVVALMALFFSIGAAYAQAQPDVHIAKPSLTPEVLEARKAEHKAKMATLTPAERKAFRQARQEQRQARLNAMPPKQRTKHEEHRRLRKETKREEK